jgi:hypothetical protein
MSDPTFPVKPTMPPNILFADGDEKSDHVPCFGPVVVDTTDMGRLGIKPGDPVTVPMAPKSGDPGRTPGQLVGTVVESFFQNATIKAAMRTIYATAGAAALVALAPVFVDQGTFDLRTVPWGATLWSFINHFAFALYTVFMIARAKAKDNNPVAAPFTGTGNGK